MPRIFSSPLHAGCACALLGLMATLGGCEEGSPNRPPSGMDPIAGSGGSGTSTGTAGTEATSNAGTTGGGTGGSMEEPPPDDEEPEATVFGFANGIDGWFVAYTDPPYLMQQMVAGDPTADAGAPDAGTTNGEDTASPLGDAGPVEFASISHDPVAGSHQAGSLVVHCPFQGFMRDDLDNEFGAIKVGLQYNFPEPVDLTNATILASARLNSGVYDNAMTPAGVKLSIRSGESSLYADGGFTNLLDANRNMWFRFAYETSNPAYEDPGDHDLSSVTALGIEISTNSTGAVSPGSVHIDTIEIRGGATAVPRQN